MQSVDLVVFDMIGTTVAATDKIPQAFERAFAAEGIALGPEDINLIRGRAKLDAIRDLLEAHGGQPFASNKTQSVYAAFKGRMLDCYRDAPVEAIDGADDTLAWCREQGIAVALTTGFDRDLAGLLVERLGWEGRIDSLVCNDDVEAGRPAPDLILAAMRRTSCANVARVASVGDTVSDLQAGANAGTGFNIGVLSGAHSREQLSGAPHTALISSVAELPARLQAADIT